MYPYIKKKQTEMKLPETQKTLIIWDVFRGQMTERVKDKLTSLSIEPVSVPANMTHFFQPLDLTVNGSAIMFMRKQFTEYCSHQLENIEVDFRLTSLKPLHSQ